MQLHCGRGCYSGLSAKRKTTAFVRPGRADKKANGHVFPERTKGVVDAQNIKGSPVLISLSSVKYRGKSKRKIG